MPNRTSKRPTDINQLAKFIVDQSTAEPEQPSENEIAKSAAALLGRRGGLKGGPARAQRLSAKRRKEIAREAAKARWLKTKND